FVAAGSGQQQQLQRPIERSVADACAPQRAHLEVGENSLPLFLLEWTLDPRDRGEREHVTPDQPVEELREKGGDPFGQVPAAAGGDAFDQVDHIALADAVDRAAAPRRQHDAIEHALGSPCRRLPGLAIGVELEERGHRRLDAVPTPSRYARYTRYRHYAGRMRLEPMAMGRSRRARRREREAAVTGAAEGALAVDAVVTVAHRPGARARGLNNEIEAGTASVGIFRTLTVSKPAPLVETMSRFGMRASKS